MQNLGVKRSTLTTLLAEVQYFAEDISGVLIKILSLAFNLDKEFTLNKAIDLKKGNF